MKIYYAFYKGAVAPNSEYYDKIITKWTRGPYSHVEIIINGYMYSSSPRDGGVRVRKHAFDFKSWDYIEIKIDYDAYNRFLDFFERTKNNKYDWLGIAGFVFPLHDSEKRYFCSEWCSKAGIILGLSCFFDKNPARISPNRAARILHEEGGYEFVRKN